MGLLGHGLIGVADGVQHGGFLVFDVFRDFPEGVAVDFQDFPGDQAVFGKSAAPGVVVQPQVHLAFAAEEVPLLAGGADAADVGGVIRDHPLAHVPVGDVFAHPDDLACKFVAADGIQGIRAVFHPKMLHIRAADGRRFDFDDQVVVAADRFRHVDEPVSAELFSVTRQCLHTFNQSFQDRKCLTFSNCKHYL